MNDFLEEYGARFDATKRITDFGDRRAELSAAQAGAILVDQRHRDRLELSGSDAASFLNRLLTFAVHEIDVGAGCRPFMLDSRGRILLAFECLRVDDDRFIVDAIAGHGEAVSSRIDMFHFGEDFAIADISDKTAMMSVAGPKAADILESLSLPQPGERWSHAATPLGGAPVRVIRSGRIAAPTFDIWTSRSHFETTWRLIVEAGATPAGEHAIEALRLQGGTPAYPSEFGEHSTPLDAGGIDGLTDGKGCYPGQEVIERTIAMGRPALSLVAVQSEADVSEGSRVTLDEKDIGSVTSGALLGDGNWIGLALIKTRYKDTESWRAGSSPLTPRMTES